jgi:hypothetical protein
VSVFRVCFGRDEAGRELLFGLESLYLPVTLSGPKETGGTVLRPLFAVMLLAMVGGVAAQPSAPDSARRAFDTVYVIPAGPVAGTFTPSARLTVTDTVANWARVLIEGWVPVSAVMDRPFGASTAAPYDSLRTSASPRVQGKSGPPQQCAAITKKGTRCKRLAAPGSKYCWQHQR